MRKMLLGFALLITGMIGVNSVGCASGNNPDEGIVSKNARDNLSATTQAIDEMGKSFSIFGMPLVTQIASTIAALGGGVLLIDKAVAAAKQKKVTDGKVSGG